MGRFLFLEPFFGGSHRDFAEGLAAHSRHRVELAPCPRGSGSGACAARPSRFCRRVRIARGLRRADHLGPAGPGRPEGALGSGLPPALVYFHENQLTYPLAPGESLDLHFGFTNITTALARSACCSTPASTARPSSPGCRSSSGGCPSAAHVGGGADPPQVGGAAPGLPFSGRAAAGRPPRSRPRSGPPLVIWNHRWEFDKNPAEFFAALDAVRAQGLEFRLALLGESFQAKPKDFLAARERFGGWIVQYGLVADREAYLGWLRRGEVVVSTAIQENFGLSVVEAMRCGCLPLLPERLSYPEILPPAFHREFLYRDREELVGSSPG